MTTNPFVLAIEAELTRLGAMADCDQPCLYVVTDEHDDLPEGEGQVRIYDDHVGFNVDPDVALAYLRSLPTEIAHDEIFAGWLA